MARSKLTRRALLRGTSAALAAFGASVDGAFAARNKGPRTTSRPALEVLWSNRTYFVRPDGNDRNSGLTDSSSGAFRTWQGGYSRIVDSVNFNARTVVLKAGGTGLRTFTAPAVQGVLQTTSVWQGGGTLRIIGEPTAPDSVVLSASDAPCFRLRGDLSGEMIVAGFTLRAPDNWGIRHGARGNLSIGHLNFDTGYVHVGVEALASYMDTFAPYTIIGDAERHIDCDAGFMYFRHNITIVGERTFATFVRARNGGRFISDMSFDVRGSVRGTRFQAKELSLINTQGRGFEHFPGNVAGEATTGGAYIR